MSNSAFTPTILQDFREASVSQSGIVTTTAQTFSGHKLVKSTTAQQITAYGWSTARNGASDNDGEIRLGIGPTSGFRIQQHDSGATTTYLDNRYDSVSSSVQFRTRTDGTPIVAFQYTGAGACTIGPASGAARHLIRSDGTAEYTLEIQATNAAATDGLSNGLAIHAGITAGDTPFYVTNRAANLAFGICNGVGAWAFGTLGGTQIQRAYGSEFRLQGESTNGTQLSAARTKLLAPIRQNIAPSASGTFENGQAGALHIIKGYGTGDNASKRFTDFVVTTESGWTTPTAVLHSSGINSPNARTYTVDGSNRLVVSLGSGGTNNFEVNVAVFSL